MRQQFFFHRNKKKNWDNIFFPIEIKRKIQNFFSSIFEIKFQNDKHVRKIRRTNSSLACEISEKLIKRLLCVLKCFNACWIQKRNLRAFKSNKVYTFKEKNSMFEIKSIKSSFLKRNVIAFFYYYTLNLTRSSFTFHIVRSHHNSQLTTIIKIIIILIPHKL